MGVGGAENDGPRKLQGLKMQDLEDDGPCSRAWKCRTRKWRTKVIAKYRTWKWRAWAFQCLQIRPPWTNKAIWPVGQSRLSVCL